jgi:uncharacterized protein YndB with AHSA1/START domain
MKNDITGTARTEIHVPKERVWEALITPEIIKKYFFGTDAISDWQVGSPLIFKGEWQGKHYEDKGNILAREDGKLFKYSYWSSMSGIEDKPENYVIVTYELAEKNGNTLLTITQENIPDEKMKAHSEENWNKVLAELKDLLENQTVDSV